MLIVVLVAALVVIVAAAELFTNALEHLGERLGISEGVTGSIFAAVGTAMPETLVPLFAIFAGSANRNLNEEIGVGAILGAPLMLSTLSLFFVGMAILGKRRFFGVLHPEAGGLRRDLEFFLLAFGLATAALYLPHPAHALRVALAGALLLIYFVYLMVTIRASDALVGQGHGTDAHHAMFLSRFGLPQNWTGILLQLILGLVLLVGGAKGFVYGVERGAALLGISPLLLSLLAIPIATELPEKVNSILWIRRDRDTLAFGNITGAMVFQGTLLPAIGILLTPWQPHREVLAGTLITLAAVGWLRLALGRGRLRVWHLMVNGLLYAIYLALTLP